MFKYILSYVLSYLIITANAMEKEKELDVHDSLVPYSSFTLYDQSLLSLKQIIIPDVEETNTLLHLDPSEMQNTARRVSGQIKEEVDHIIASAKNIQSEIDKMSQPAQEEFNLQRWGDQKTNGNGVDFSSPRFEDAFHSAYSLGGEHSFEVAYKGGVVYEGFNTCGSACYMFSTCNNEVPYKGIQEFSGKETATCSKEHHKCQCNEIKELILAYRQLEIRHTNLEGITARLMKLTEKAKNLKDKLGYLDNLVTEQISTCVKLSDEMKKYIRCAEMTIMVQKTMAENRDRIARVAADEHEKSYCILKDIKDESKEREKGLQAKLELERNKCESLSKDFIDRLDAKQREHFIKLEEARNTIMEKYESKIDALLKEKEVSIGNFYKIQSECDASKLEFIKHLFFSNRLKPCKDEASRQKIQGLMKNYKSMSIEDIAVLANEYLLGSV